MGRLLWVAWERTKGALRMERALVRPATVCRDSGRILEKSLGWFEGNAQELLVVVNKCHCIC
jgi:hypothetical protein